MFPDDAWTYQFPTRDASGRLLQVSGRHYLPAHSYERRTFIKVRASRACETLEKIASQDVLMLLEHLRFTTEWVVSREQPKDVDARVDLQDFISLNHLVEEMYQRTAAIEKCEAQVGVSVWAWFLAKWSTSCQGVQSQSLPAAARVLCTAVVAISCRNEACRNLENDLSSSPMVLVEV